MAVEAFLFWGNDFPIGEPARVTAHGPRPAATWSHDNMVVVGTSAAPALRIMSAGVTSDYRAHICVDGQLWWDVGARERPIPNGWSDLYGKGWVPADTGLHVLRMVVDATGPVAEIEETNNEQRLEVKVVPGDRSAGVRFAQWRDGYPQAVGAVKVGSPVLVLASSAARGAYPGHRAVLDACGEVLLDHRVSLSGGTLWADSRTDTLIFTPQASGACEFRFAVDPDQEFPMDADRSNNASVRTLTVLP